MLEGLDSIPWKRLSHAYGSAEDVPELLRALWTDDPEVPGAEGPLWQLFGNILHQGTVYSATAHAVPFLLELAASPQIAERIGVLDLLACIASGGSEPHAYAENAHQAVAAGIETLISLTDDQGDVHLAAAHVLVQLPECVDRVNEVLQGLLRLETLDLNRAGLLLLLGQMGLKSADVTERLLAGVNSGSPLQRHAAAISLARLRPDPMPSEASTAILEALVSPTLERRFEGLPWDAAGDVNCGSEFLYISLDEVSQQEAVERWINALESGTASYDQVANLVDVLFPQAESGRTPKVKASDLTPRQTRAVRAIVKEMEGGRRIFYGHFPSWGLPDTNREWRDLAQGRDSSPIDLTLPLLTGPNDLRHPIRPDCLKPGERVSHRHFGLGTVLEITPNSPGWTRLQIEFDEEGIKLFSLPSDGSPMNG